MENENEHKDPGAPVSGAAPESVPETQAPTEPRSDALAPPTLPSGTPTPSTNSRIRIVGIGGSAGSLEALQNLFQATPTNTGMAFVLVPHLAPDRKDLLGEILQRHTGMPICQAEDGIKIKPDCIYIIPPNKNLTIVNGTLQLLEFAAPHGLRLPIDYFFRQLADDQGENAVCIILSGMGSDGSAGLKSIKEQLGYVLVQEPSTARYDGMPTSAIDTGYVDFVLPVEQMPAKLVEIAGRSTNSPISNTNSVVSRQTSNALQKIWALLRGQTGNDFSHYKENTVIRRIERRMGVHQLFDIDQYVRYLQSNDHEVSLLFKELLIGVTSFFRDPEAFEILKAKAIRPLIASSKPGHPIRVWAAGCSTGEEAYSIAILFQECIENRGVNGSHKIQIFASDLDEAAITYARQGVYPASIEADMSPERLARFFTNENGSYKICKDIREMLVFAPHNVLQNPPFNRLDILSCRNLLIYLTSDAQKRLLPVFINSLAQGGYIFLGSSETIGEFADQFRTIDAKSRLFQRHRASEFLLERGAIANVAGPYESTQSYRQPPAQVESNYGITGQIQHLLLEHHCPAAALINNSGDVLYINGHTGKYLELPVGKVNYNLYAMAREGLRFELVGAAREAVTRQSEVTVKGVRVRCNGTDQIVDLKVQPLAEPTELRGLLLILFVDVAPEVSSTPKQGRSGRSRKEITNESSEIQAELVTTRNRLQTVIEQMQASEERLQSANEEMQSTNEEMQSTNEELTTSREEMQSLNEELLTVNAELQTKNETLTQTFDDMKNLLNGAEVATLFLDNDLNIRRFTPQITRIMNLRPTDIGRPAAEIVSKMKVDDLLSQVKEVLDTLMYRERHVEAKDGRWCLMRILPSRTQANLIDGAVITFMDITALKELEQKLQARDAELQEASMMAASIASAVSVPVLVLDSEMRVVSANQAFYSIFQTTIEQVRDRPLAGLDNAGWNLAALTERLSTLGDLNTIDSSSANTQIDANIERVGKPTLQVHARRIFSSARKSPLIVLTIDTIITTEQVRPA